LNDFALIGAAGFIARRHLKAIKETGNNLVAALDKVDSVGVLDSYFPATDFFVEYERFDRHIEKLSRKGKSINYLSIVRPIIYMIPISDLAYDMAQMLFVKSHWF